MNSNSWEWALELEDRALGLLRQARKLDAFNAEQCRQAGEILLREAEELQASLRAKAA